MNMNIYKMLINAILILASIRYFRIYIRTNQIGILFLAIGSLIGSIGLFLDIYASYYSAHFLLTCYILVTMGLILQGSRESGTRKYIINNTTFYQRLLGEVPKIEDTIKLRINKRQSILIGIITIGLGLSGVFIKILFDQNMLPLTIIMLAIIWGILIIAAAIIW